MDLIVEPHHLSRLEKPPLSPISHRAAPGPEVDDENNDDTDSDEQLLQCEEVQVDTGHRHGDPATPPSYQRPRESRMYPWLNDKTITLGTTSCTHNNSDTSMQKLQQDTPQITIFPKEIRSEPVRHVYSASRSSGVEREDVRTRLLPPHPTPSRSTLSQDFWRPVNNLVSGYGSSASQGRRHSILRFGSSRRPSSGRIMKKSASVEFQLHEDDRLKHSPSVRRAISRINLGRDMPRRLTEEEKEELYRIRPDLEIGPTPFFKEQMEELNRRNQKRILFAMFGGIVTIVLLLVFYALFARG